MRYALNRCKDVLIPSQRLLLCDLTAVQDVHMALRAFYKEQHVGVGLHDQHRPTP
jgi:hypothetical protein